MMMMRDAVRQLGRQYLIRAGNATVCTLTVPVPSLDQVRATLIIFDMKQCR